MCGISLERKLPIGHRYGNTNNATPTYGIIASKKKRTRFLRASFCVERTVEFHEENASLATYRILK
jgi:hypothetical protein